MLKIDGWSVVLTPKIAALVLSVFVATVSAVGCETGARDGARGEADAVLESKGAAGNERPSFVTETDLAQFWAGLSNDRYFKRITPFEVRLKSKSPFDSSDSSDPGTQLTNHYSDSSRSFSRSQMRFLEDAVDHARSALRSKLIACDAAPWILGKVTDNVEGGLLHTQRSTIVVPGSWIRRWVRGSETNPERNQRDVSYWLLHEYFHVLTQRNPRNTHQLMADAFNGIPAPEVILDAGTNFQHISNPDATASWAVPVGCPGDQVLIPFLASPQNVRANGLRTGQALRPFGICANRRDLELQEIHILDVSQLVDLRLSAEFREMIPFSLMDGTLEEPLADLFAKYLTYDSSAEPITMGIYPSSRARVVEQAFTRFCDEVGAPISAGDR